MNNDWDLIKQQRNTTTWGCSMQGDFATFDFPITADLETLLAKDINGLYYCRLVAASMAFVDV